VSLEIPRKPWPCTCLMSTYIVADPSKVAWAGSAGVATYVSV